MTKTNRIWPLAVLMLTSAISGIAMASGAVYTATNGVHHNEVLAYRRADNGALTFLRSYDTGGRGSGGTVDPLQSQGSVVLSADDHYLFVVNSGSGDISSFNVKPGGALHLIGCEPTLGGFPNALAVHGNILYALDAGGAGAISGYWIQPDGKLKPIQGSMQYLSGTSAGGSSIQIAPDGSAIVVTERLTGNIDVFPLWTDGTSGPAVLTKSNGAVPFSGAFTPQGVLAVAEAGGGPSGTSAISSYTIGTDDDLTVATGSLGTGYAAACWIVASPDGDYAFIANAASSEISTDSIADDGTLAVVGATSTSPGAAPLDLAITPDGRFLYALTIGSGWVSEYQVQSDGSLTALGWVPAQPAKSGQNGLAAF
jgi:6-phosphogluconolactonase (cycloisomerase 2 family)